MGGTHPGPDSARLPFVLDRRDRGDDSTGLRCRRRERVAFLCHKGGDQFHGRTAVINPFVNFAGLYVKRVSWLVGRRRPSFVVNREGSLDDINSDRARMSVSSFAASGRDLNRHHDGLIARNGQVLRQQHLTLDGGLLCYRRNRYPYCRKRQKSEHPCAPAHWLFHKCPPHSPLDRGAK